MKQAFTEEGIEQPESTLIEAHEQAINLTASESELDIPEVFELRPLSTQRVTVKVRNRGPARFYFVKDDDVSLEAIEG
jgi:hypothetical protein